MEQLKAFFVAICCYVGVLSAFSQTIKLPEDLGKDCDAQTYHNCINYIKNNRLANGEKLEDFSTRFYPISSNGSIFVMYTTKSHIEKTKMYSDNGFFDPVLGWSNTATLVKNVKKDNTYVVFVNNQGEPLQSIGGFNSMLDIIVLDNNRVLLLNGYYDEENGKTIRYYREIVLFELNGTEKWRASAEMYFRDYALTNNNIYIVGSIEDSHYKVLSLSDGSVKLDKSLPASNYETSRFTKVSLTTNGVVITREFKKNKKTVTETFPYESNDKSYKEGLLFKSYDKNKASDQVSIGTRYFYGDGFSKDYKKAVEWYEKAANQNNSRGLYCLGYCYHNGLGVNQDKTKAASLYEKASNQGEKNAIEALSKMYLNGDGVAKDLGKALHWQEILAFNDDKEAQKMVMSNQSVQYEKANISASEARNIALNSHSQKDYSWAEFCIRRAIELGNNDARLDYGMWLAKGEGIQKDYSKAEEYLTPFAESGIKDAASVLGMIYRNLNDKKKEMYWVEKAALDGDVDSQLKMAEAYQNGIGVKKDKKAAAAMYEKAAEKGNVGALIRTVYAYAYGNGVKKNLNTADKYFRMLPHQIAFEIANSIFWGHDVKKDKHLGLAFYLHAGQMGNQEAMKEYEFWSKQMKTTVGW
jgi:TPR repeat protein